MWGCTTFVKPWKCSTGCWLVGDLRFTAISPPRKKGVPFDAHPLHDHPHYWWTTVLPTYGVIMRFLGSLLIVAHLLDASRQRPLRSV